jgi:hypothetical protein
MKQHQKQHYIGIKKRIKAVLFVGYALPLKRVS